MDILLRGLAKRASSVSDRGNGGQQTVHLDADELNAFAENSLPPAARSRYTAHLVDCSQCRKLVAELSAAAGLPRTESKTDREVQASFWQRLPAFLSPAVLRYAVPALAILAVITIGLITFRQQPMGSFVARQAPTNVATSPIAPETPAEPLTGTTNKPAATSRTPEALADSAPSKTDSSANTPKEQSKGVTLDGVSTVDSASGVVAKDASKAGEVATQEPQPKFAPEPAPPAAAAKAQVGATAESNKNEAVAKQKADDAEGARQVRDERLAAEERDGFLSRSRKAATAGRGGSVPSTAESRRNQGEEAKRSDADKSGETREVAGRRFRKQGNAWVDSAYAGARPVMTVVRGSEQYRVLIADEPGIRTVAETLAGEVIVVWKGRAYRIR